MKLALPGCWHHGRVWAFELERRGAGEINAIDLVDPVGQDVPHRQRLGRDSTPPAQLRGQSFRTAAELLGSRVAYHDLNVYDLDPSGVGQFDLVVIGYVLQLVRDPLRALEAVRGVCRGWVLVLDTVSAPLSLLPAPLARPVRPERPAGSGSSSTGRDWHRR